MLGMVYHFFPQWQGWGNRTIHEGAILIHNVLRNDMSFTYIPVRPHPSEQRFNINSYDVLLEQLTDQHTMIGIEQPDTLFTLGADCAVSILPITYLNLRYGRDVAVVWLDGHADLNTPDSSPSKTFHGMPVRFMLGEGEYNFLELNYSTLSPQQILYIGARDFDPPEAEYIVKHKMNVLQVNDVRYRPELVTETLKAMGYSKVYVHLDVDVMDSREFPHVAYPQENGFTVAELKNILEQIHANTQVVGGALTECTAELPHDVKIPVELFKILSKS
jgi:arginase